MTTRVEYEVWLGAPREQVFAFFADAGNLQAITPPWLNFEILTPLPLRIFAGALIEYRLRLHRIPLRWQTEITAWEPPARFVDEQRRGPYRLWRHEHTFEEKDGGTLAKDRVTYSVAGGWIVDRWFVRRDVERIFKFRREKLLQIFPGPGQHAPAGL